MPRDDLLPYPLAGADPGSAAPVRPDPDDDPGGWRRWTWPISAIALVVVAGLLLGLLALWEVHRADRALIEDLSDRLAAAEDEAARQAASGQEAAAADEPVADGDLFGAEMLAASEGVDRFRKETRGTDGADSSALFVRTFFGHDVTTRGWRALPNEPGPRTVLASVDDPAVPRTIWVSRRSSTTADPKVPARTHCLALNVDAIVDSVVSNRESDQSDRFEDLFPASHSSAPLRWWSDTYVFVPASRCG